MAKNGRLITAIITCTILVLSSAGTVLLYGFSTKDMAEDASVAVGTLKVEGCAPAKKAVTDIAVIESQLTTIKDDVKELRIEQRAGTKLILDAIKAQ